MMTREEFEYSLTNPLYYWSNKTKDEVGILLCEDVAAVVHYVQRNPHHCYDLFNHILHTVDALDGTASSELRIAAFFHDIGKPYVAMEKQGRLVFYDHASKSAEIAGRIITELGYDIDECMRICFYIEHHDDFINWVLPEETYDRHNPHLTPITKRNLSAHINSYKGIVEQIDKSIDVWRELIKLCEADADSQAWYVYRDGKCIDSKAHKLRKLERILSLL